MCGAAYQLATKPLRAPTSIILATSSDFSQNWPGALSDVALPGGIVDQDVDAALLGHDPLEQRLDLRRRPSGRT